MKITIIGFLLLSSVCCLAQDDDTITYIHGLPVAEDDTAQQIPQDLPPFDRSKKVNNERVPSPLRKALESNPRFKGWENEELYYDENNKLYRLVMKKDGVVQTYSFDEKGNVVSLQEKD